MTHEWVGVFVVMVVCTLFSGKNTNNVQNLPPRPLPPPAGLTAPPPAPSILDYPRTITGARVASGIALTGVGTNETFTFDPPTNAVVCADWRPFGLATDAKSDCAIVQLCKCAIEEMGGGEL